LRIFHLLSEHELFSEPYGGAISRWVANVTRLDESTVVVTSEADGTWDIPSDRVLTMPKLKRYRQVRHYFGSRQGWPLRKFLVRALCAPLIELAEAGDLVWVHNRPETAAAIAPLAKAKGVTIVLHMHNSHLRYTTPSMLRDLEGIQTVYVSRYLQKEAEGFSPNWSNGIVLYNGADGSLFRPKKPLELAPKSARGLRILFVGRLVPDKGAHVLCEALKRLAQREVAVTGVIVGADGFRNGTDSEYVTELKSKAASNTEFRGHLAGQALVDEFQAADLFCVPSVWDDPFPLSPLEAMASGLPVIASRSGGVPEALQYGGGVIVEKGSVEELEAAIERFVASPELRLGTAKKAVESFEKHFTWPIVRREFRAIVDRVMQSELKGVS
jgi:spore coat protein SA